MTTGGPPARSGREMRGARSGVFIFSLALAGCSKANKSSSIGETPAATLATAHATPGGSAAPAPSSPPNAVALPESWSGHYPGSRGSVSIPDAAEWAGVKFRGDDAGVGLGDGDLSLSVAPGGRAHGALDG